MSQCVSLQNISYRYRRDSQALLFRHLEIAQGEKVFIHGPSGYGKTTLLGLVTGVLSSSQGKLAVLGTNLVGLSQMQCDRFRADHMGYIFQQLNLIPYLSVIENILVPFWMSRVRLSRRLGKTIFDDAHHLVERLQLNDCMKKSVLELSVGQQQRVAVARALIGSPELIVADEPTSALDENLQEEFLKLLLERVAACSSSLLFVSHQRQLQKHFDRSLDLAEIMGSGAKT